MPTAKTLYVTPESFLRYLQGVNFTAYNNPEGEAIIPIMVETSRIDYHAFVVNKPNRVYVCDKW